MIYNGRISDVGIEKVERSVVYNATAAFALIDNLEAVQFYFYDLNYQVFLSEMQAVYKVPLSELANVDMWERSSTQAEESGLRSCFFRAGFLKSYLYSNDYRYCYRIFFPKLEM